MFRKIMDSFVTTPIFAALLSLAALCGLAIAQTPEVIFTDLHNFDVSLGDPTNLIYTGLIPQGRGGNLFGVSKDGENSFSGTVFKLTPSGSLTVLSTLDSTSGYFPQFGLTLGADGSFYGAGHQGGSSDKGTIFRITPAGSLKVLHNFTMKGDGSSPVYPPVLGDDGNLYGISSGPFNVLSSPSILFRITPEGIFTVLHRFVPDIEGSGCDGLTLADDGNFYGGCGYGGANGKGTLYRVSPGGVVTVLHSLTPGDGTQPQSTPIVKANDGNFYGVTTGGVSGKSGGIYRLTPSGEYRVLHDFSETENFPYGGLTLGPDGALYGTAIGSLGGLIFKITTRGDYSVLYNFDGTHDGKPFSNLTLRTDGLLYGDTWGGGTYNNGIFYSLNVGFGPLVSLVTPSGKVGSKIGILGQGFSAASVVKFNGVAATTVSLRGKTFLLATVPKGASNGYVTVTTGGTALKSLLKFVVHNSWSTGAAMPTAVWGPMVAALEDKIYVVGGTNANGKEIADVQIYDPLADTWSSGTPLPTPNTAGVAAVVNGDLYIIGGYPYTDAVWAYSPATKKWSAKAAMPAARTDMGVAVVNGIIHVIGGNTSAQNRVNAVESYDPATDSWSEEAPLLIGKSEPSVGVFGTSLTKLTIVAPDGYTETGDTGDDEAFDLATNVWTPLKADPTPRNAACSGRLSGGLYIAGGYLGSGAALNSNEVFMLSFDKWKARAPMPQAALFPGSAVYGGKLFCIGGSEFFGTAVLNNVQVYQP